MEDQRTRIIVEIASSHNGDLELAKALIRSAACNGADIVKFQDWSARNVPATDPDKLRYERYQLPSMWYPELAACCEDKGVELLTSCFNADRVKPLAELGFKKIKIASVCLSNTELLMSAGAYFDEVIASTAMQSQEAIEEAADLLASNAKEFTLLACTANYPMTFENANLARMNALQELLEGQEYAHVGYSSHALDLDVPKLAIARGARYVEVHFSLSRDLPQIPHQMYEGGPLLTTHSVSLEPHELKELADWRNKVEIINGSPKFESNEVEQKIKSRYLGRYGK